MPILEVQGLAKSFGENLIFRDVNFQLEHGDCVSIIGPSGCGKSTLLRCINMLETPSAGQIYIKGREITAKNAPLDEIRRDMGMVYQSFNLFSHKTVLENVMLAPMLINGLSKQEAMALGMECLAQVGMTERADFHPHQLSGGQKQRAAIARCVAMKPELILFDEPTSALDPTMVDEVLTVIRRLVNQGMTCMIVTHEMNFAKNVSSHVMYMDDQGIYEMGPPSQVFDAPEREKTRSFVQRIKTFSWTITSRGFDIFAMNQALEDFCRKQMTPPRQVHRLELVLEELLMHLLLPRLPEEQLSVEVTVNYSVKEEQFSASLRYAGPTLQQQDIPADDLSLILVQAMCQEMEWQEGALVLTL